MKPNIRSGPSIVDGLVTRTGGSTTGETNCAGPASDIVILPLHKAEVAASA